MPIYYCEECKGRYVVGFDTNDFIHQCNSGNPSIDNEDVVVIGDWEDYSGSGTKPAQEVLRQGSSNQLQGRRAGLEGWDKDSLTRRGNRESTHRQRPKLVFKDNIHPPARKDNVENK